MRRFPVRRICWVLAFIFIALTATASFQNCTFKEFNSAATIGSSLSRPPSDLSSSSYLKISASKAFRGDRVKIEFKIPAHIEINLFDVLGVFKSGTEDAHQVFWVYTNGKKTVVDSDLPLREGLILFETSSLAPGDYELRLIRAASSEPLTSDVISLAIMDPAPKFKIAYADTRHNAFPSVARAENGDFIGAFRSARQHMVSGPAVVRMIRSKDRGNSWTENKIIYANDKYDCSPGSNLTALRDGTLMLAVDLREIAANVVPMTVVLASYDNGASWVEISKLPTYTVPYGRMFELKDGSIVMPGFGYVSGGGAIFKSFDRGKSWILFSSVVKNDPEIPFGTDGWTSFTETSILPLEDNQWVAVLRGNKYGAQYWFNGLYVSRSRDGGNTWSNPEFLFEGASPDLIRFSDGSLLLCVSSRDSLNFGLGVRCHRSFDLGASWGRAKFLATSESVDSGYPYSIPLGEDEFYTIFYRGSGLAEETANIWGLRFHINFFDLDIQ